MANLQSTIKIAVLDQFSKPLTQFDLKLEEVKKEAQKVEKAMGGVERAVKAFKTASESKFKFADTVRGAAEGVARFAETARNALAAPIEAALEYDKILTKIRLSGNLSGEALSKVSQEIKKISATSGRSIGEVSQIVEKFLSAKGAVENLPAFASNSLNLSKATGIEGTEAADFLINTRKAFRLAEGSESRVADVLSSTGTKDFGGLIDFLKEVAPMAAKLGMSLENTAAIGAMSKEAGMDSGKSASAFATLSDTFLGSDSKVFRRLGLNGKKLQNQFASGDISSVLSQVSTSLEKANLGPAAKEAVIKSLFGNGEAATLGNFLLENIPELSKISAAAQSSTGTAASKAAEADKSPAARLQKLMASFNSLLVEMGEALIPMFTELMKFITPVVQEFTKFIRENPGAAQSIMSTVGAIAALTTVLAPLALGLSVLSTGYGLMSGTLVALKAALAGANGALGTLIGRAGGKAGMFGLVVAAGAAGYSIGEWLEETFKLSDKILNMLGLGSKTPTQGRPGLGGMTEAETRLNTRPGKIRPLPSSSPVNNAPQIPMESQFVQNLMKQQIDLMKQQLDETRKSRPKPRIVLDPSMPGR